MIRYEYVSKCVGIGIFCLLASTSSLYVAAENSTYKSAVPVISPRAQKLPNSAPSPTTKVSQPEYEVPEEIKQQWRDMERFGDAKMAEIPLALPPTSPTAGTVKQTVKPQNPLLIDEETRQKKCTARAHELQKKLRNTQQSRQKRDEQLRITSLRITDFISRMSGKGKDVVKLQEYQVEYMKLNQKYTEDQNAYEQHLEAIITNPCVDAQILKAQLEKAQAYQKTIKTDLVAMQNYIATTMKPHIDQVRRAVPKQ
jgi:hypothetical protein